MTYANVSIRAFGKQTSDTEVNGEITKDWGPLELKLDPYFNRNDILSMFPITLCTLGNERRL